MAKQALFTARDSETPLTIDFDHAVMMLEKGTINSEVGLMRWGSNYTFLVSVCHEDMQIMAIYKPRKGERPLWDFPDGTLCQREVATYHTSEAIGWRIVPPTVLRDGPRGPGSVQVFIQHDPEEHYFTFGSMVADQLQRLALFDAIVNNADRKGGHCLMDEGGRVWGIDHGLTFNTQNKLRTVIWDFAGQPIDDLLLKDLEQFCFKLDNPQDAHVKALKEHLSESEFRILQRRVQQLVAQKQYPLPGPGPNRPWPPV